MATKELVYKVKVVDESGNIVEKTAKSMDDLEGSIAGLKKELASAPIGGERFKELQKGIKASEGALEDAKIKSQGFGDALTEIPGPIGGVMKGVKGLGTAFKALMANPIVLLIAAIVAGLTALYKAFTSTKAGGEKMEQVFAGISAIIDVVRDRVLKIGGAIVKFFSGDFKGALADAKGAISGFGDELAAEFQEAMRIKKELQAIEDATRDLNKERARQNKEIAKAKMVINDETKSIEERAKALEEVRKAEISLAKQEEELARRRYEAIKAQNAMSDSSKEALEEEANAYIALQNAQTASLQKQKELFDQEKALRDKAAAERKARYEKYKAQLKEAADYEQALNLALITDANEKAEEQLRIDRNKDMETINNLRVSAAKKNELRLKAEKKYQMELEKLEQDAEAKRQAEQQAEFDKIDAIFEKAYNTSLKQNDALLNLEKLKLQNMEQISEEDLQRTLDLMKEKTDLLLMSDKLTAEERLLIQAQYEQAVQDLQDGTFEKNKQLIEAENQLRNQQAATAANALGAISQALGETTEAGKMAAIAQAGINTYLSATEAYKSLVGIPVVGPTLAVAAAAAAVVAGIKQIQEIQSIDTNVPEPSTPKLAMGGVVSGRGSSTSDSINARLSNGEAVMSARAVSMFAPQLSAMNQMGGGAAFDMSRINQVQTPTRNEQQPVIKTYVVAKDMTSQQEFDRSQKSRSVL